MLFHITQSAVKDSLREYKLKRRRRVTDDVCCRQCVTWRIDEDDEWCIYVDRVAVPVAQGTDELIIILSDIWIALELFIHSALGFIGEMMINGNRCAIAHLLGCIMIDKVRRAILRAIAQKENKLFMTTHECAVGHLSACVLAYKVD